MEKEETPGIKDDTGSLLPVDEVQEKEKETFHVKSINLSGDQWIVADDLPGVFCMGVQYYDLKDIRYLNNSGVASLIDLLKSLLNEGLEVQFVNVSEAIRKRIKALGLDHLIICG